MERSEIDALAARMFAAIEAGDLDALRSAWADDIVVWTNFGGEQSAARSLRVIGWLISKMPDLRYEVTRREPIPGGFLQQHVLRGTAPDGSEIEMPACLVVSVRDGRISRIEEYLDPAATGPLVHAR